MTSEERAAALYRPIHEDNRMWFTVYAADGTCLGAPTHLDPTLAEIAEAIREAETAARAEVAKELAEVRVALAGLEMLFACEGESARDRYERVAGVFFAETGYMRPGKSQPLEMTASDEERERMYLAWVEGKILAARAILAMS